MPENFRVSLNSSGGMMRSYEKITIENGELKFAESKGDRGDPSKWSATLSADDLAKLYKVFVENRFDTIKNDERTEIVYDAGFETISISVSETRSIQITYGKNSPLSGKNLQRYQAVNRAIDDLVSRIKDRKTSDDEDVEKYIQGKWRAAGETADRNTWFLEWTFDNGRFKQMGYPPILQEGKYKVVSRSNSKLTIELFAQKGTFGEENRQVEILTDKNAKQLSISNMKGFFRVSGN